MKFTEEKLEKAFIELVAKEGFNHHFGVAITRSPEEVLIEDDLQNFLLKQYQFEGITLNECKSIILQLKSLSSSDCEGSARNCSGAYWLNWVRLR